MIGWGTRSISSLLLAAFVLGNPSTASADEGDFDSLSWSYLYDGGVIPFVYGSALVGLGSYAIDPPDTPHFFSANEGGAEIRGDAIPDYQLVVYGVFAASVVVVPKRGARFFHFKGIGEALVTTAALTNLAKHSIGRHRPTFVEGDGDRDSRRSFFSGHSSIGFASSIYLGLYLHNHLFETWRDEGQSFAWWETIPYAALAGIAIYVPYTRVRDNRHHLSDVVVGGVVGSAAAIGFYLYQEHRYRKRLRSSPEADPWISLAPSLSGFSLVGEF